MKKRIKCRLCSDIIETTQNSIGFTECSCKQIAIEGSESGWRVHAADWKNLMALDEEGNEIPINVKVTKEPLAAAAITQADRLRMLDDMILRFENILDVAGHQSVSQYDLYSVLLLLRELLKHLPDRSQTV